MRVGRLVQTGKIQIEEDWPEPKITRPDQVLVRVRYCGINADDYNVYRGNLGQVYSDQCLFHEMSGEIIDLGLEAAAQGLSVGDRVSRNVLTGCGCCPMCRKGLTNLCMEAISPGASAQIMVCDARTLVRLPDDVSLEDGVLYWLAATCTRCVERLDIQPGSSVLILGGGATGLMILQLVNRRMPSMVVVSEPIAAKRRLALELHADVVIDPSTDNIEEQTLELTDGLGFDVVIDACGAVGALESATDLLCRGGKLMLYSNYRIDEYLNLNLMEMYWKEFTIFSSFGARESRYTQMNATLLHHLNIHCLIDQVLPLDDMQKALEMYGTGQYLRLLIQP